MAVVSSNTWFFIMEDLASTTAWMSTCVVEAASSDDSELPAGYSATIAACIRADDAADNESTAADALLRDR